MAAFAMLFHELGEEVRWLETRPGVWARWGRWVGGWGGGAMGPCPGDLGHGSLGDGPAAGERALPPWRAGTATCNVLLE